jgi:hypothetical protein
MRACGRKRFPLQRWVMKPFVFAAVAILLPLIARADVGSTNVPADSLIARVLANRPTKDFSLKARLYVTREEVVQVEVLVKNSASETRTIYRNDKTQLLVVQPVHGEPRYYLKGVGELTGEQRMGRLLGSQFSYYDLGMPFLQWPSPKLLDEGRVRGHDCFVVMMTATNQPYARAKVWIDKVYAAPLRAETFDADDRLVKRIGITSFKRLGEIWIPRGIEIATLLPGQSLPAEEQSRLEVFEGSYDSDLPADWFTPEHFGTPSH